MRTWQKMAANNRGAAFLETALVLPVFIALLLICLDGTRVLGVRQRLAGANRLSAELHARGCADAATNASLCTSLFLGANQCRLVTPVKFAKDGLVLPKSEDAKPSVWSFFLSTLPKIMLAGYWGTYVTSPLSRDECYGYQWSAEMNYILPPEAYKLWLGSSMPNVTSPRYCYMPNCDPCQDVPMSMARSINETVEGITKGIQDVIDAMTSLFSWF